MNSAPRISEEGLPVMLVALLVTGTFLGGLLWWGHKNAQALPPASPPAKV